MKIIYIMVLSVLVSMFCSEFVFIAYVVVMFDDVLFVFAVFLVSLHGD